MKCLFDPPPIRCPHDKGMEVQMHVMTFNIYKYTCISYRHAIREIVVD